MEKRMIDRIWAEIDEAKQDIKDLAKVVHTQSGAFGFVVKLLLVVITFLIIAGLTVFHDWGKQKHVNGNSPQHTQVKSSGGEKK